MPLSPGDKLGPYEILALIGKGGMGEVYRARDPRLKRDVAIKVSAAQFSERFEREATAIAALNHNNICQIYDVGPNYLVMEFIEGESPKGPLPLKEALRIAHQIADALEAAHEKGITHRDLKPGNIKIKPDGTVKVLDFGLAKMSSGSSGTGENSPTLTIGMTDAGMILGTASYMAPEQARAKEAVDKRADIWAFGVVLYELITGKRLFTGEDVGEILAKVIRDEPDLSGLPPQVVPLLKRCLEKDPKKRLRDIGDAWALLVEDRSVQSAPLPSRLGWVAWGVAGLAIVCASGVSFVHFREVPPPVADSVRFEIAPPPGQQFAFTFSISPDGRHLLFNAADQAGVVRLWIRSLDATEARPLVGTEGNVVTDKFWSPDSRSVGYFVRRTVKIVDIAGGTPRTLCELPNDPRGGAWAADGTILLATVATGLLRIPAAGGTLTPVTSLDHSREETMHARPYFFPDGRHFLYIRFSRDTERLGAYLGSLDVKPDQQDLHRIAPGQPQVVYIPSRDPAAGHLLFLRDDTLMAQSFDAARMQATGEAVPALQPVGNLFGAYGLFSASENGVIAYRAANVSAATQLFWFDREGKRLGKVGVPAEFYSTAISPDGTRIAEAHSIFRNQRQDVQVWVLDLARGTNSRLTFDQGQDAVWSPDGRRIAYQRKDVYWKDANGAGSEELLAHSDQHTTPTDISRDGRFLLYESRDPKTGDDLWALPLQGERKPFPILRTEFAERQAKFSPDSRWIAYLSNESGRDEVYVRPFSPPGAPPAEGKWLVSNNGAVGLRWRSDGREILYMTPDGQIVSVEISAGPAFRAGMPRALGRVPPARYLNGNVVGDFAPDGQRVLIAVPPDDAAQPPITVITNWQVLLNRK